MVFSYLNGALLSSETYLENANYGTFNNFGILHTNNEETEEPFNGIIDEVRITTSPKSSNWIATEYKNQNDPRTFYSASASEQNTQNRCSLNVKNLHLKNILEQLKEYIKCEREKNKKNK
jgi:hypothetical protein